MKNLTLFAARMHYPNIISITLLSLQFAFTGCAWFDQSEHRKITGDYEVGWNDLIRNRSITKLSKGCDGCAAQIVDSYVYAIGHDSNFIIAKQHPGIDTITTNYFIIDIRKNEKENDKGIYGPLSFIEFDSLKKELKIAELNFDLIYIENPR